MSVLGVWSTRCGQCMYGPPISTIMDCPMLLSISPLIKLNPTKSTRCPTVVMLSSVHSQHSRRHGWGPVHGLNTGLVVNTKASGQILALQPPSLSIVSPTSLPPWSSVKSPCPIRLLSSSGIHHLTRMSSAAVPWSCSMPLRRGISTMTPFRTFGPAALMDNSVLSMNSQSTMAMVWFSLTAFMSSHLRHVTIRAIVPMRAERLS